jgi:hypothetical protein
MASSDRFLVSRGAFLATPFPNLCAAAAKLRILRRAGSVFTLRPPFSRHDYQLVLLCSQET